jgi:hypothetical protein
LVPAGLVVVWALTPLPGVALLPLLLEEPIPAPVEEVPVELGLPVVLF